MKRIALLSLALLFSTITINAQLSISHIEDLVKAKTGTTYVGLGSTSDYLEKHKDIIDIYKKYWTATPIQFCTYNQMKSHYGEENASFITINSMEAGNMVYVSYDFWVLEDRPLTKKRAAEDELKDFGDYRRIASYPLYYFPFVNSGHGYDGVKFQDFFDLTGGMAHDFTLGILKNMVQQINAALLDGKEFKLTRPDIVNASELSKLKTETLYIPKWIFLKGWFNTMYPDSDIKAVLQDYKYKYELIDNQELSTKIMTSSTPVYYLKYHKDGVYYMVSIINSLTGEAIYFTGLQSSKLRFERKYMKRLFKKIEKS